MSSRTKSVGFASELKAGAGAKKRHHGWRSPRTIERSAAAARHYTSAVAAPQTERKFQNRRQHHHAIGAIENALGRREAPRESPS